MGRNDGDSLGGVSEIIRLSCPALSDGSALVPDVYDDAKRGPYFSFLLGIIGMRGQILSQRLIGIRVRELFDGEDGEVNASNLILNTRSPGGDKGRHEARCAKDQASGLTPTRRGIGGGDDMRNTHGMEADLISDSSVVSGRLRGMLHVEVESDWCEIVWIGYGRELM